MKYFITVPLLLFLTISCENPITFVWEVDIIPDSNNYYFTDSATLTITNRSENFINIRECNGIPFYRLQRQIGVEWSTIFTAECPGNEQFVPLLIDQSASYTINFSVISEDERRDGTYRVEFYLYPGNDLTNRLPVNMRVSNSFSLTIRDQGDNEI